MWLTAQRRFDQLDARPGGFVAKAREAVEQEPIRKQDSTASRVSASQPAESLSATLTEAETALAQHLSCL